MDHPDAPSETSDLLARLRRGNEADFQDFVRQWARKFEQHLREHGFSAGDAYELGLSCATHVLIQLKRYRGDSDGFKAWAWRVAKNFAEDQRRKQHGVRYVQIPETMAAANPPDALAETRSPRYQAAATALKEALEQLPEEDREIIRMRYLDGSASFREIGGALGLEEATVRVRHHRILFRLKELLEPDWRIQALL